MLTLGYNHPVCVNDIDMIFEYCYFLLMTQITERPAERATGFTVSTHSLLEETSTAIRAMRGSDSESGAALLDRITLLLSDPYADKAATVALFFLNNSGGRDTLNSLFYGESDEASDNGPIVAPTTARVQNLQYRTSLNKLHAALNALIPDDYSSLDEKRDFWESVKAHLPAGQPMDDGQVSEVTAADLNTVLKAHYGAGRVRKLTAFTDVPEHLNFVLFNPRTVEHTKLEIRASFKLFGEEPPVSAFSLRTMNGVVHFV